MIRKRAIPVLTMLLITAQLTGCAAASSKEITDMMVSGETIEIMVTMPEGYSEVTSEYVEWKELASLTDQKDLRKVIDDELMIISYGENSKNGVLYVNPDTEEWEPNNTLENVYKNKAFLEYWGDVDKQEAIASAVVENYTDIEDDVDMSIKQLVAINGYFNIVAEEENGAFNENEVLSRADFM